MKHKFKKNRYQKSRGTLRFLTLACTNCKQKIALYQKDGPGPLLRMYLDRIFEPQNLSNLNLIESFHDIPNLKCPNCDMLIATPMVYEKENRFALRVIQGSISKTKSDGIY